MTFPGPLQERHGRWTCVSCGMVNRAFRNECFGTDCNSIAPSVRTWNDTDKGSDEVTEFKDENSNIICRLPTRLAKRLQSDVRFVVQGLVESNKCFVGDKLNCLEQTTALQKKMRKGLQVKDDFENIEGGLWGYAQRKFSMRAVIAFELWRSAQQALLDSESRVSLETPSSVMSIGGGPGNDMFGYMLFRKYHGTPGAHNAQLVVADYAAGWGPIVSRVSELSGQDIAFQTTDLSLPLHHETNAEFHRHLRLQHDDHATSGLLVFTFVYVLSEVMGSHGKPPPLLLDLLDGKGVFLFREPHTRALTNLLQFFPEWCQGVDFWQLSNGGLMILRR